VADVSGLGDTAPIFARGEEGRAAKPSVTEMPKFPIARFISTRVG
jgi:hypothetical protein